MRRYILFPLAMLATLGCEPTRNQSPNLASSTATPEVSAKPSASVGEAPVKPASDTPVKPGGDAAPVVAANNAFGFDMYKLLAKEKGNLAFSPTSLSVALSMTYAGAKGDTAAEMAQAMHLPDSADAVHAGWATVLNRWQSAEDIEASVANRMFGDKTYSFEAPFLAVNKTRYGAPVESVNFIGAPEPTRVRINEWVAQKTHDRIKNLIPKNGVTRDTRMALVNAMYFKAAWAKPFQESGTEEAAFAAPDGSVDVPMMRQTASMRYADADGVQLAELDYKNRDYAALFVLPEAGKTLSSVEANLDAKTFDGWTEDLSGARVRISLPKFKIDPAAPYELKSVLIDMGMKAPFDRGTADFTAMANPKNAADRLFIEKVFHKAFVAMDEKGTEAAAATAVVMGRKGAAVGGPKEFNANRPFLFFIRDKKTGMVIFAGRVEKP